MIRKCLTIILIGIFAISFLQSDLTAGETKGPKKRIAVFEFEDKTDHAAHWWTGQPVGRGMADMLVTALVASGKYTVIERQELDQIMKEQSLGQSGLVTPESAAKVGKLLGVELAVVGSVTEFGHKKGGIGGRVKGFGLGVQKLAASVGVDVRFINTTTGEILDAKSARAEKTSHGLSVDTPEMSFDNQKDFDESIVGKACREAIDQMTEMIGKQMDNLPWQGKIIKVTGNTVIINAGAESGIEVGSELVVYAPGEELIDPDTGLSLGSEESLVGKIKVTQNTIGNGKASKCDVIEGSGFKAGDFVRLK
ncbi:CsgG/HfaB family protein [candidate division KSB1 bacterium]|nr:CsgG/HfaB family protein [candidate division KSB1 bacterium]